MGEIKTAADAAFPDLGHKVPADARAVFELIDSAITTLEAASSAGRVGFLDKATMDANLDYPEGTVAEVRSDPTPANNGLYQKVGASGTGSWSLAEEDPNVTFGARVDDVEAGVAGVGATTSAPNVWPDPEMRNAIQWVGSTRPVRTIHDDVPALQFATSAGLSPRIKRELIDGNTVSFGFDYTKAAQASQTVALRQYDAGGSIIQTDTFNLPSGAAATRQRGAIDGITIDSDTVEFAVSTGPGSSGNAFVLSGITLVAGDSSAPRPSLRPLGRAVDAFAEVSTKPNVVDVAYLLDPDAWGGSGTLEAVDVAGRTALKVSGGSRSFTIPRGTIGGSKFSASFVIEDKPSSSGASCRVILRQRSAASATLVDTTLTINDAVIAGPQEWIARDISIHADCDHLLVFFEASTTGGAELTFSRLCIVAGGDATFRPPLGIVEARREIFVDLDAGDDGDVGSYANPMATIAGAISALKGRGKILVSGATSPVFSVASAVDLEIVALPGARPQIRSGIEVTGISKTGGYTNVYEGSLAFNPAPYLFVDAFPEGEIAASERHALQWGRQYRSPVHRLVTAESVPEVDATPGSYYWDSETEKAYFHLPDSGDGTEYRVYRPGGGSGIYGGVSGQTGFVRLVGFESYFGTVGFDFKWTSYFEAEDCHAYGAGSNGFRMDQTNGLVRNCSAHQSWNDNFNQTFQPFPTPAEDFRDILVRMEGVWGSMAFADGFSNHGRCRAVINGAFFERNLRGVTPATGAELLGQHIVTRSNTEWGFMIGVLVAAGEGGIGTTMTLHDCVSIDEVLGVGVKVADAMGTAYGHRTINCTTAAQADGGRLEMVGWSDSGSGVVKGTDLNGGSLIVPTFSLVT